MQSKSFPQFRCPEPGKKQGRSEDKHILGKRQDGPCRFDISIKLFTSGNKGKCSTYYLVKEEDYSQNYNDICERV